MMVKIKLSNEVAERWKNLKSVADVNKVKFDETKIFDDAFSRALDNFEMGELAAAGHELSPELAKKRQKRIDGVKSAKETAEQKRPSLEEARLDPKSLHYVIDMAANLAKWEMSVTKLAGVLRALNIEFKRTKIKNNVSNIVIEATWNDNHKKLAEQVFLPVEKE